MEVSAVEAFTETQLMDQIVSLIGAGSKSGWLGITLSLVASGVLGFLYFKIQRSRNSNAEETQKIRHTTQSQILTENRKASAEQLRAERAVYEFLKDDIDGHSGKSLGDMH